LVVAAVFVVTIKFSITRAVVGFSSEDGHELYISEERTKELEKNNESCAETTDITQELQEPIAVAGRHRGVLVQDEFQTVEFVVIRVVIVRAGLDVLARGKAEVFVLNFCDSIGISKCVSTD
jgi:hypothetical protein